MIAENDYEYWLEKAREIEPRAKAEQDPFKRARLWHEVHKAYVEARKARRFYYILWRK